MSVLATELTTDIQSSSPTDWCYVSGRVSVLETMFLNRNFFETLLRSRGNSEARSALAKTQYRQLFTTDDSLKSYTRLLDNFSDELKDGIMRDAPPHVLVTFFDAQRRYTLFRTMFLRYAARGASAQELESTFDTMTENPAELSEHRTRLKLREAPQNTDSVARSLFLDSAACTFLLNLAETASESAVSGILQAMAVLKTWAAVLRNCWNGTSAEVVQKWFVIPEKYTDMINATVVQAESNPVDAISGYIPDTVYRRLRSMGNENLRRDIDICIGEAIRDDILMCRHVPYGPEKILAFFVGYNVEQENLRLVLASVIEGIDSGEVVGRLRKDYA